VKLNSLSLLILLIFLFTGCIKEPTPKGFINLNNQKEFNLIYSLSKKCYTKKSNLFSDGIVVEKVENPWHKKIRFMRYINGFTRSEPFITLSFKNNKLYITEGTYECGYKGCIEFNIKKDIENWLKNEYSCSRTNK